LIAVDFPKFFETAEKLYDLWPSFFNWAGGCLLVIAGFLVTAGWWLRGYKADTNEAALTGEKNAKEAALTGEIKLLEQRHALATELQAAAEREAERFKSELNELKEKVAQDAPPEEIQAAVTNLEVQLGKFQAANNATTAALSSDEIWKSYRRRATSK
jgi:hypothetical protein